MLRYVLVFLFTGSVWSWTLAADETTLRLATFTADITTPLGHRCMGILETKVQRIEDPLEARGFVLLGPEAPVVFLAMDWCEIRNGAYDLWRDTIAAVVNTSRERVLVCSLHQHDAPVIDTEAQTLLDSVGLIGELFDAPFHQACLTEVTKAIERALPFAKRVTHIATGQAAVDKIASNRRIVHEDGVVRFDRYSRSSADSPQAVADAGEIDPNLKAIHFLSGEQSLAVLSSYATHPMSYYGQGVVSADFVGLARRRRQTETPGVIQIYATGCSGDVTAGKYNDGSGQARAILTDRLHTAMVKASQALRPQKFDKFDFRCESFHLPFHEGEPFKREAMMRVLHDTGASDRDRILAAMGLASLNRIERGQPVDLPCLDLGIAQIVVLPAESFVAYQLLAQRIRPKSFVMAIGFGECWPGYIPTQKAFDERFGHDWRWVGAGCETILREKLESVLSPAKNAP